MGTALDFVSEKDPVEMENKRLRQETRETRQAAIFSAVELLHRLGVSGDDAEKMWRGELSANFRTETPNVELSGEPLAASPSRTLGSASTGET